MEEVVEFNKMICCGAGGTDPGSVFGNNIVRRMSPVGGPGKNARWCGRRPIPGVRTLVGKKIGTVPGAGAAIGVKVFSFLDFFGLVVVRLSECTTEDDDGRSLEI